MQVEIHRHLEASLRLRTAYELAQKKGIVAESTSLDGFRQQLVLEQPVGDLSEFLARFDFFQQILDRPEILERIAFEAVEDCWNEGTRLLELRYSPSFISEKNGLSWKEVLSSFQSGLNRARIKFPEIRVGLICIATRDYGPQSVDDTVEFFLQNSSPDGFIGLDLAGNETRFPCGLFEYSFKKAVQKESKITIHAGEAAGPENMWQAIELLGAHRIGHGIHCIQDPQLMKYLSQNQICLEICPTSNWLTQASPVLKNHPLPKILRSGIPVSINTDDPSICGVTLGNELQICRAELGLSEEDIEQCEKSAELASFVPPPKIP